MSTIYGGIDPGINGAIALLDGSGTLWAVYDMPKQKYLANKTKNTWRNRVDSCHLAFLCMQLRHLSRVNFKVKVERVTGYGDQGSLSAFNFGDSFGHTRMAAAMLDENYSEVTPIAWKKKYDLKGLPKSAAVGKALELIPNAEVALVSTKTQKITKAAIEGRADALLIAHYCLTEE